MRQISTNTWGVDDIVQRELIDEGAELQQQGQRLVKTISWLSVLQAIIVLILSSGATDLSNATSGASNNYTTIVSPDALCNRWALSCWGSNSIPALTILMFGGLWT